MIGTQLQALAPLVILSAGAIVLMLQIALSRQLPLCSGLTQGILLLAAAATPWATQAAPLGVTPLLLADPPALVLCALFCIAAAVTAGLSRNYLAHRDDQAEEYFLLLLLSTLGACVLACSVHVASLLLGLELMSVALYALIGYPDRSVLSLEAAIKYLVLSGAASATVLFGFALLYAATGQLGFAAIGEALAGLSAPDSGLVAVGAAMLVAGLGFKLSVVPFHLWTPDVYEGAPAPVTGYLAAVSKAAVFVVLLRLFLEADLFRFRILVECIGLMAILSMLAGNLLALLQSNIKRLLAYSSIAHVGYLLIVYMAVLQASDRSLAIESAIYYLVAYAASTLAAFALVTLLANPSASRDNIELQQISGLFWQRPLLALMMMVAMLSLAGIPLTAGFIAKFYIISAAVAGSNWILLATLVVGSGIGIYYYLRVVYYMSRRPEEGGPLSLPSSTAGATLLSVLLIGAILLLGTVPQPLLAYLRSIL